jgi:hypothetical protein
VDTAKTVSQLDQLQKLTRKVNLASLAVRALGADADHQAVEEQLVDVLVHPRALGGEGRAQARDSVRAPPLLAEVDRGSRVTPPLDNAVPGRQPTRVNAPVWPRHRDCC